MADIALNHISEEGIEAEFFRTFFEKIGKRLVISHGEPDPSGDTLTIMPILQDGGTENNKKLLSELYENYKAKFHSLKIIPLETDSLYRACVDLGLLLGINAKKIRRAYEKALEKINGKTFDCYAMLVISPENSY